MKQYSPYFAGLGFATIFGFSYLFTKDALGYISPFHLLGLRFAIAVIFMSILRVSKLIHFRVTLNDYKTLMLLSIFQPIMYFTFETIGVLYISTSQAGMMIAIIPIFVTILAALVLKEYPSKMQIPFILGSVSGVLFIMAMQNQKGLDGNVLGSLLLIAAVISAALYNITTRRKTKEYKPIQITWVMMVVGAVTFNFISLLQHGISGNLSQYFTPLPRVIPAVLYLGILSSVTAFFLVNYALSKLRAAQSSVFSNLTTVISIVAGVTFLGEKFQWYHGVGALLILTGVWGTNRFAENVVEPKTENL